MYLQQHFSFYFGSLQIISRNFILLSVLPLTWSSLLVCYRNISTKKSPDVDWCSPEHHLMLTLFSLNMRILPFGASSFSLSFAFSLIMFYMFQTETVILRWWPDLFRFMTLCLPTLKQVINNYGPKYVSCGLHAKQSVKAGSERSSCVPHRELWNMFKCLTCPDCTECHMLQLNACIFNSFTPRVGQMSCDGLLSFFFLSLCEETTTSLGSIMNKDVDFQFLILVSGTRMSFFVERKLCLYKHTHTFPVNEWMKWKCKPHEARPNLSFLLADVGPDCSAAVRRSGCFAWGMWF